MSEKRIVFKALDNGKTPDRGVAWPLPQGDKPGEWMEVDGPPLLCRHGLHGYLDWADAIGGAARQVYEMEVAGEVVEDHYKLATTKARLLRLADIPPFVPEGPVETGAEPCRVCGKPHSSYRDPRRPRLAPQWGDLEDGHCYHRMSFPGPVAKVRGSS